MGVAQRTRSMKTFLSIAVLLATTSSWTVGNQSPGFPTLGRQAVISNAYKSSALSRQAIAPKTYNSEALNHPLVGQGIARIVAEVYPVTDGVVHGTAEVYPVQDNPSANKLPGSFSLEIPNLGVVHVKARFNHAKGSGYLADFVYDGSTAKTYTIPAGNPSGSFPITLPNLGTVLVNARLNEAKGYGYLADIVFDASAAKSV